MSRIVGIDLGTTNSPIPMVANTAKGNVARLILKKRYLFLMIKTAEVNEFTGRLAELIKQVQAGNEVLLTEGNKPVAKIISATAKEITPGVPLKINSLKGHRALTPSAFRSVEESEAAFRRAIELAGGEPKEKFTKKDERDLLRMIHEDRKKHRSA